MAVLYRKYRPQTFAEVLNQKYIIQTLKNQVKSGSIAHAYLFTGSRGVGKTSVARILAKAANCQGSSQQTVNSKQSSGDACGECDNCKAIAQNSFLDLVEIDAASNTGVDNIRELIEHVKFAPTSGKYKFFIIDEVHMLSKGAFNALLKTLEEPPKHAVFVLATTEINKVPATIISRTQRFDFKALSTEDIFRHLQHIAQEEKINFDAQVLHLIANNAEGSVRDALSLMDKLLTLGENASLEDSQQLLGITDAAICENLLGLIAGGQTKELPEFINTILEKGLDFKILNRDFLEYLRKALVYKVSGNEQAMGLSAQHQLKLKLLADKLTAQDFMFIIRLFLRSYKELETSPAAQIPLLLAALEASLRKAAPQALEVKPAAETANNYAADDHQLEQKHSAPMEAKAPPVVESAMQYPESGSTDDAVFSLPEVRIFWPKVIAKIKEVNGPLSSLLRSCELVDVSGSRVILAVKFLFNKQNLENAKNSGLISSTIFEVTGKKMRISAQVLKVQQQDVPNAAEAITQALQVFGGELIE